MTVQGKDGVGTGRGTPRTKHRKSQVRARIFRELVHIAAEQGASIQLGVSTADALQECLDRAVSLLRFAQQQVDSISRPAVDNFDPDDPATALANLPTREDPLYEVIPNPQGPDVIQPHRYLIMEREARQEVEKLAAMMTQLGIAERVVRVREAEAALLVSAVRDAAIATGLSNDQVRALGAALRTRIEEGSQTRAHGFVRNPREIVEVNRELEDAIPGQP